MPYTDGWDDSLPAGGENANTIDDEIRKLKLSIHERMDALVDDWTADPVVPKGASIGGVVNNKKLVIPYSAFVGAISTKSVLYDGTRAKSFCDLGLLCMAPVLLPLGSHFRYAEVIVGRDAATTQYVRLRKLDFNIVPNSTNLEILTNVAAGIVMKTFTTIDLEMDGTFGLIIDVIADGSAGNGHEVYGAVVTYDAPDGAAVY